MIGPTSIVFYRFGNGDEKLLYPVIVIVIYGRVVVCNSNITRKIVIVIVME